MAVLKVPFGLEPRNALVNVARIGSFTAQRKNWAHYLSRLMNELIRNFAVLISELAGMDVELRPG
jgi:hypothetical protein